MDIFSFWVEFGSEAACILHFKKERDKIGVSCKCGKTDFFWIKNRLSYECKSCKKRITLRSGTTMENSNLSFLVWYKAIFLMGATKKGFSAKEMQKPLGLKHYQPVWAMMHKLRKAMGKREDRYTLEGVHIFISNAKRNLLGNYHKIKRKNLQLYLNEIVYKLNRRYFGDKIFDRLVVAAITGG